MSMYHDHADSVLGSVAVCSTDPDGDGIDESSSVHDIAFVLLGSSPDHDSN